MSIDGSARSRCRSSWGAGFRWGAFEVSKILFGNRRGMGQIVCLFCHAKCKELSRGTFPINPLLFLQDCQLFLIVNDKGIRHELHAQTQEDGMHIILNPLKGA
jgi:hypothetical protein